MTTESFTAWLIHKQASGDTSSRLTIFTQEKGLVRCLFRGGRTLKKQMALQLFSPLWVEIDNRSYGQFIQKLESITPSTQLPSMNLFASLYVNELIYYALKPLDAHPELYDTYQYTMRALCLVDERLAIEAVLRRFEWQLLSSCGVLCSFEHEANTHTPINPELHYQYRPAHGFVINPQGLSGTDILAISQDKLDTPQTLKTAKYIMRQAIDHLLAGKVLKSRSLFKKV